MRLRVAIPLEAVSSENQEHSQDGYIIVGVSEHNGAIL